MPPAQILRIWWKIDAPENFGQIWRKIRAPQKRSNLAKKGAKIIWIYSVNEQKVLKFLVKNRCPWKFWSNLTKNRCPRKFWPNLAKNSRTAYLAKFLNLKGGFIPNSLVLVFSPIFSKNAYRLLTLKWSHT